MTHPTNSNIEAFNQLHRLDLNDPLACQEYLKTHEQLLGRVLRGANNMFAKVERKDGTTARVALLADRPQSRDTGRLAKVGTLRNDP